MKLIMKEWKLCMHPTGYLMPLLAVLVLVPGYPYGVCCFYVGLAIFFICLTAREDHDAGYTLMLPVSRRDAVRGRILFCAALEAADLMLMGMFILIRNVIGSLPNPAGLDAGAALIGDGMIIFALFNRVFFPVYYKDILKPGKAFACASAAVFLYIVVGVAATYALPFVRDNLDTPDPAHMTEKLVFLAVCACWYVFATALSVRIAAKRFEQLDLQL